MNKKTKHTRAQPQRKIKKKEKQNRDSQTSHREGSGAEDICNVELTELKSVLDAAWTEVVA